MHIPDQRIEKVTKCICIYLQKKGLQTALWTQIPLLKLVYCYLNVIHNLKLSNFEIGI